MGQFVADHGHHQLDRKAQGLSHGGAIALANQTTSDTYGKYPGAPRWYNEVVPPQHGRAIGSAGAHRAPREGRLCPYCGRQRRGVIRISRPEKWKAGDVWMFE